MSVAVIGGTGFYHWPELNNVQTHCITTPYSTTNIEILQGSIGATDCYFLPRHGRNHATPPHKINYQANIDALHKLGVSHILGINAVGGIADFASPGSAVIPDQIIDYTWGRKHTFFDDFENDLQHIDFTNPLQSELREIFAQYCSRHMPCTLDGVYGCTQGPRLESTAEINRLRKDGCDVVGMTLMPEAALAREKNINYLSICVVANWAAGITEEVSLSAIQRVLEDALTNVRIAVSDTLVNL